MTKEEFEEDIRDAEKALELDYKVLRQALHDCDADLARIENLKIEYKEKFKTNYPDSFLSESEQKTDEL